MTDRQRLHGLTEKTNIVHWPRSVM